MNFAQIFLNICLAILIGIGIASLINLAPFFIFSAVFAAILLFFLGLFFRYPPIFTAAILLFGFIIGFCRFNFVWEQTSRND